MVLAKGAVHELMLEIKLNRAQGRWRWGDLSALEGTETEGSGTFEAVNGA